MHLADAFIQSDLQVHSGYTFIVSMCSLGIEPTTFALLTQCSTTEPQEHSNIYISMLRSGFLRPITESSICRYNHRYDLFITYNYL